ncbi:MAG: sugar transferase [Pseudomonadota bacterium]
MTAHFKDSVGAQVISASAFEPAHEIAPTSLYRAFGKRLFDVAFVLIVAPLALLLVALGALSSAIGGMHWPFYAQVRVGLGGKAFKMLKIRTMVEDADARLAAHLAENPAARREWEEKQKLENDPRITKFGDILRKSSLDEMPQLWNVLKGDMSIVGPRPMMMDQRHLYPGTDYYLLRPGVTGPWQVSDRSQGSFAGRAQFDAEYNEALSLKNDLRILARTVGVVLRCTGR